MPEDAVDFFISRFKERLAGDSPELPVYYRPRSYRNASVRFRGCKIEDFARRRRILEQSGLNVFLFPAAEIPGCDLLSDSGTSTMTMEQWASLFLGDEAYGSNEGYFALKAQITETFGPSFAQTDPRRENLFIFHQGRAAENAFFGVLSKLLHGAKYPPVRGGARLSGELECGLGKMIETKRRALGGGDRPCYIIPSNSHFDTTEANIASSGMLPLNLPCREHVENDVTFPFRGNLDLAALENLLENEGERVPLVYITVTNNTGGGQPVSMANIREAGKIARKFGKPLLLDACRFAENAWFIGRREAACKGQSTVDIIHGMFSEVDGFHISLKKDGLVNMGGALVLKQDGFLAGSFPELEGRLTDHQILTEGHPTYGGLTGRDLGSIVQGLKTIVCKDYLDHRIGQVERFGKRLSSYGIPIITPVGGHAVYIDMDRFFSDIKTSDNDFKGIAFTALLLIAGHRFCELGLYAFGRQVEGEECPPVPRVNYVRGAVPRLAYEERDLFAAAEAVKVLYDNRGDIPGVEVTHGKDLFLRHFKSRFRFNFES